MSIPASFASCRNGRIAGSTSASDDPDRGGDERPRQAVGEPDDEDDEPERQEVEGVAVVEAVVAPRRARERRDDEEPGDVRGDEQRRERELDDGSRAALADELREHDRRDRERDHGEVELDVGEVVDEPLATPNGS